MTCLRVSLQADDGYLYPLERAFFYVHKPPLLLLHEDVESVEFCRQGGGGAASTKTFDLAIRDRQDQVGLFLVTASPAALYANFNVHLAIVAANSTVLRAPVMRTCGCACHKLLA